MKIGYKLATEAFGPAEVIEQTRLAEQAGFDFVEISDHFHPWLESQGHSGFTWSLLGAMAVQTERIGLVTGVTCPSFRYHPAIIAQAAATVAILSQGRFTLGVGSGERLNEHVTGQEFPGIRRRHEVLREALEIIRLLWRGRVSLVRGHAPAPGGRARLRPARDATADAGRSQRPGRGPAAAELGDGLFANEPKRSLVEAYEAAGGSGPRYGEVPLAWAPDEDAAAQAVLETTRWAVTGWKVMSELPNPVNFAAATTTVTTDDLKGLFACGPDVGRHLEVAQQFVDAGFDHLVLQNAGPDPKGFIDFYRRELAEPLRQMTPAR